MTNEIVESQVLEFKRMYSSGILKTVIAFANTDGGELMIGVQQPLSFLKPMVSVLKSVFPQSQTLYSFNILV